MLAIPKLNTIGTTINSGLIKVANPVDGVVGSVKFWDGKHRFAGGRDDLPGWVRFDPCAVHTDKERVKTSWDVREPWRLTIRENGRVVFPWIKERHS